MKESLQEETPISGLFADSLESVMSNVQSAKHAVTYDALVLDAKLRQSLVTVRSLGRHNRQVAALETSNLWEQSRHVPTFSSRWCQHAYIAPGYERQTEPFLSYLLRFLDNTGARVLITSSDGSLALVREHRAEIERRVRVALAKEEALEVAINKEKTQTIAKNLGIEAPKSAIIRATSDVSQAIREIGLPAVVKPVESWLWGKSTDREHRQGARLICQLVTTFDEAQHAVEELTMQGGAVLFQQFIEGKREAISFLYAHDTIYARFAQLTRRTQPPLGGTSVYRQSIALPADTGKQAERLVREIGLEGYSEVEFRRDRAGKPYLMEINPRLSASVEVAVRAGVDFPYLLYQWANGDPIGRVELYREGYRMRFLEGDALATMQAIQQRGRPGVPSPALALFEFFSSFLLPAGYDYLDWNDPLPVWIATLDSFNRAAQQWQVKDGIYKRIDAVKRFLR